jgi:hypothetical protein
MPVEYLSAEQEARYGRFVAEPAPGEMEQSFRLDAKALELARARRRAATRLGWAAQWGTVRMLGTFLTEEPASVPVSVVAFVAGQLARTLKTSPVTAPASRRRMSMRGRSGTLTATGTSPRGG